MEVFDDLFLGTDDAGFVVPDACFSAVGAHDVSRSFQVVVGHDQKQVVFDLVIEPA